MSDTSAPDSASTHQEQILTGDDRAVMPGQQPEAQPDLGAKGLVEPEGVNAGSGPGERDRRPDGEIPVRPSRGGPAVTPPVEEAVGMPEERSDTPGQQLGMGEG